ncbi:type VII secretion system-associated protein [Streptomyces lonarensis]|uniref:Type VII secretion system-associated protein n=1 Tax=Streptomyces lonarensis TaxID=700599 RepID=A0A7X6HZE4_9ACTN|nr:type VII secretion system-associated protein [Streptomyces lonarensis]NJQ06536.1 type VII secretion system-associated protein [Streptomyces lonarensis]
MSTDDSGEDAGTLKMNKDGLQSFLENEVDTVKKKIKEILSGNGAEPMSVLAGRDRPEDTDMADRQRPLALGLMVSGNGPGTEVNNSIKTVAGAVDDILDHQLTLFTQIISNLESTIEELLTEQGKSLEDIDGQALLDVFSDVETELTGDYTVSGTND